jgi:hypothetical protein
MTLRALFSDISRRLTERELRVLLIGGNALQAYGVVRQTLDIDWLAADQDVAEIKQTMLESGLTLAAETENFLRFNRTALGVIDVDVLLVDRKAFESLCAASVVYELPSGPALCRVPSLSHIIALKLHAIRNDPKRETRDVVDIMDLIRATGDRIADGDLAALCQRFGPDGIHDRIRRGL